jgi:glycosyltransferase involved in cell wall biosynthesis
MREGTTVVVCAIPTRMRMLSQALASVAAQTFQPVAISVSIDHERSGAAVNRQRAFDAVDTEWTAFLDDDDYLLPKHLERLVACQHDSGADLVFPWFDTEPAGCDPFPMHEGRSYDPKDPHQFPITYLVRTEVVREAGGFVTIPVGPEHADGNRAGEDWDLQLRLGAIGAKIVHLPERTWVWRHHGYGTPGTPGNTSGLSSRW